MKKNNSRINSNLSNNKLRVISCIIFFLSISVAFSQFVGVKPVAESYFWNFLHQNLDLTYSKFYFLTREDWQNAIRYGDYDTGFKENSSILNFLNSLFNGYAYLGVGEFNKSIKYFENARKHRFSPDYVYNGLGYNSLAMRDYNNSEKYFLEALRLNEFHFMSLAGLSRIYFVKKDYNQTYNILIKTEREYFLRDFDKIFKAICLMKLNKTETSYSILNEIVKKEEPKNCLLSFAMSVLKSNNPNNDCFNDELDIASKSDNILCRITAQTLKEGLECE